MKSLRKSTIGIASLLCIAVANIGYAQSGSGRGMMERFQMLDANSDGHVSAGEAGEWHEAVFLAMDANEDRKLTREEYMSVQMGRGADPDQRGPRYAERQLEKDARFTEMDADQDGYVTHDQFLVNGQHRFAVADTDKDGAVSAAEFRISRWQ